MKTRWFFLIAILFVIASCSKAPERFVNVPEKVEVQYPDWVKTANIYEVNIRQYTPEGTFKAFQDHLPRLKEMGVDILWIMPVHPIGEANRKGSLGSYYAVQDYKRINPEFGTQKDFIELVNEIHKLGMHVIIDWVANHTSWDNVLMQRNPEFYTRNEKGAMVSPVEDWTDVADLNYDNYELREYMSNVMQFYLQEYNIDGFRCDVAGMVPTDFWEQNRNRLNEIKPVFMLAESETPELLDHAFDMDYAWNLHHIFNGIADGKKKVEELRNYYLSPDLRYEFNDIRMIFTSNHDENSWNGTAIERLGEGTGTFAALSVLLPGMPLVYNGQEVGIDKRLSFFDKDSIEWKTSPYTDMYKFLFKLKRENPALWNGQDGGIITVLQTTAEENVFSFARELPGNTVVGIFNLSDQAVDYSLISYEYFGEYSNPVNGETIEFEADKKFKLEPWSYLIGIQKAEK